METQARVNEQQSGIWLHLLKNGDLSPKEWVLKPKSDNSPKLDSTKSGNYKTSALSKLFANGVLKEDQ